MKIHWFFGLIYVVLIILTFLFFDTILSKSNLEKGIIVDKLYDPPYKKILVVKIDDMYYEVDSSTTGFYKYEKGDSTLFHVTRGYFTNWLIQCKN